MTNDEKLLKIVYDDIKDQICDMEILTPELFTALFFKNAAEHNIELNEDVAKQYIDNQILNFKSIQNETSQKANELSESTLKAITAIQDKDETTLQNVLEETKALKQLHNLREAILKKHLKSHEKSFKVSFSFGVSEYNQSDSIAEVIERADENMYTDKVKIKEIITGIEV